MKELTKEAEYIIFLVGVSTHSGRVLTKKGDIDEFK